MHLDRVSQKQTKGSQEMGRMGGWLTDGSQIPKDISSLNGTETILHPDSDLEPTLNGIKDHLG